MHFSLICSTCRKNFPLFSSFMTCHRVCNQGNTTGVISGAGTAYPSDTSEFIPGFQWGSCYSIFRFTCNECRSLFVLLYFFFWPLCCLFFCLLVIVLSVLLRFTDSDYPFCIIKLFLDLGVILDSLNRSILREYVLSMV